MSTGQPRRRPGLPASALDDLLAPTRPAPAAPPPAPAAPAAGDRHTDGTPPSRHRHGDGTMAARPRKMPAGRHKLTTYLPEPLYAWVAAEVAAAQDDGHPASIADAVRYALEHVRADRAEDLRRVLRNR